MDVLGGCSGQVSVTILLGGSITLSKMLPTVSQYANLNRESVGKIVLKI